MKLSGTHLYFSKPHHIRRGWSDQYLKLSFAEEVFSGYVDSNLKMLRDHAFDTLRGSGIIAGQFAVMVSVDLSIYVSEDLVDMRDNLIDIVNNPPASLFWANVDGYSVAASVSRLRADLELRIPIGIDKVLTQGELKAIIALLKTVRTAIGVAEVTIQSRQTTQLPKVDEKMPFHIVGRDLYDRDSAVILGSGTSKEKLRDLASELQEEYPNRYVNLLVMEHKETENAA